MIENKCFNCAKMVSGHVMTIENKKGIVGIGGLLGVSRAIMGHWGNQGV